MRKIGLESYDVKDTTGKKTMNPREICADILLSGYQQHNGSALLTHSKLANKITDCKEDSILLEDSDWGILQTAVENIKGLNVYHVKTIDRILNAETVVVTEKKGGVDGITGQNKTNK